ncbi:MAG: peptidoglycan editing factor PgeF, partial [Litorivicinus sp.]
AGGVSTGQWDSLNLGTHVHDSPVAVAINRQRVTHSMGAPLAWMDQVHGVDCVQRTDSQGIPEADAQWTEAAGLALAVGVADCLPVGFCADDGSRVGVAHAGWRGLAGGVIEATAAAMGGSLIAVLGPCIGQAAFQVGPEVREKFCNADPAAASAFVADDDGRWRCDLRAIARQRLKTLGIEVVYDIDECTYANPDRWFSFRRHRPGGRMALVMVRHTT